MNPLPARSLLPEVAQELNQDIQLVTDISEFFWSYTHKALSAMEDTHVMVHHLGTFHTRYKILLRMKEKLLKKIPPVPPKDFRGFGWYKEAKGKLLHVEELIAKMESEFKGLTNHRIDKRARKFQQTLEEQEQDMGGYDQQDLPDDLGGEDS